MISGGWVPTGIWRMAVWEAEVTCAVARRMSTLGWKIDLDDADALHGLALDMLDIVHGGGEEALIARHHARADISSGDRPV